MAGVAAGMNHSLAVTQDGQVLSWGYNGYSILGRYHEGKDKIFHGAPLPILIDTRLK